MVKMKKAQRWNPFSRQYKEVLIPKEASAYEEDMEKKVECVNCSELVEYGSSYTSMQFYTEDGFGYSVCFDCYEEEKETEENARMAHILLDSATVEKGEDEDD